MKKIQCTKCGQTFWKELQIEETLVASGEWIQHPCPRCGAEWAIVEPGGKRPGAARRRVKPKARRRITPKEAVGERLAVFTPARIRSLRRKLGISQKELAVLTSVSPGAVGLWEKGKFKPKKGKVADLSNLAKMGKEGVRKLLAEKMSTQLGEKKLEETRVGKAKGKERKRRKALSLPNQQK